jgi:hypothetical protein
MAVYDDGSGPALYAGGTFTLAGGVSANGIAKWDGASWSPLSSGINPLSATSYGVSSLIAYDDGSGPALFVGGWFQSAGGIATDNIAKWNGVNWSTLEGGLPGTVRPWVRAMVAFDAALYLGSGAETDEFTSDLCHMAMWGCRVPILVPNRRAGSGPP